MILADTHQHYGYGSNMLSENDLKKKNAKAIESRVSFFGKSFCDKGYMPDITRENSGVKVTGARYNVEVIGLYRNRSLENILDGAPTLMTKSSHYYMNHGSLGHTGYNYMGGHHWFSAQGIDFSDMRDGIIIFSNGIIGIIDLVADGCCTSENAYVYYSAYSDVDISMFDI